VNLFLSPPFADFQRRLDGLLLLVNDLQRKCGPGSVLVLQSERHVALDKLPFLDQWDRRRYGRNELSIWVKETVETQAGAAPDGPAAEADGRTN
jgi:hypothetical protein